jgi:hypothetical protein
MTAALAPLAGSSVTVDPVTDSRWSALAASTDGSLFASPPWIGGLADAYGFEPHAHVLLDPAGAATAGIAYVELDDLRGPRIVSLPFCDHVDPIAPDESQWQSVVAPLLEQGVPVTMRCLDNTFPVLDRRFTVTNDAAWHATRLDGTVDEVAARFHPSVRQSARRAAREGVSVRFSTKLHDVRAFHALHCHTRKYKYRMLAQPLAMFEALWDRFAPTGSICVGLAEHEGQVVGGALYFVWNGVFYYKFGASRLDALSVRPNQALVLASVAHAVERGCSLYDWGLSEYDQPGLVAYKRKLADEERSITSLRFAPAGWCDPAGADGGRTLQQLGALFAAADVPDATTQRAGELLYRYFA